MIAEKGMIDYCVLLSTMIRISAEDDDDDGEGGALLQSALNFFEMQSDQSASCEAKDGISKEMATRLEKHSIVKKLKKLKELKELKE